VYRITGNGAFHYSSDASLIFSDANATGTTQNFSYTFETFAHPFVGDLIKQLNLTSLADMLNPDFLGQLDLNYWQTDYGAVGGQQDTVTIPDAGIDTSIGGPYACYNWELLYHIPVMIAVHLSNNQRFAEAQKWFHLVFDPTSTDGQYWKSFVFRNGAMASIAELIALISTPDSQLKDPALIAEKTDVITGYNAILANPFQPHVVARTRQSAYQWYVVMKYLDSLIAWGDTLFLADTIETLNEATLCYVLAAQILGPRPQSVPQPGSTTPRNFLQLKHAGLDTMADAMVTLEGQFPFNLVPGPSGGQGAQSGQDQSGVLFGIGRSLYFAVPPNPNLLGYWDVVADRLFKIRNSENIQGVAQQLPLFDPPINPGMLVKAAAAGLDVGSIVSGVNQPIGPVRAPLLIQKALEIAGEVRSLGNALLSALEKSDAEQLALKRQGHEVKLQQMMQHTRYLQWQHAQETTNGLLRTRDTAIERYTYYLSLLGQTPGQTTVPGFTSPTTTVDRPKLTEANFDDTYKALIAEYDLAVPLQTYPDPQLAQGSSPSNQSGATGQGQLYLNKQEDAELNIHMPIARNMHTAANVSNAIAGALAPLPSLEPHLAYWGLGIHTKVFAGEILAGIAKNAGDILLTVASYNDSQAGMAGRTAGYQRRVEEWTLQANLAARELRQIGRQIIASLIAEQVAHHDYTTVKKQVDQAKDIQTFLQTKFTSADFYTWMHSDLSGLYYQYYRFACDTARKAEQTMKQELMRPELDATQFIQYNYWDSGHQGLLSGEALYLDVKRMEMAYHDNNKRELELTRHVSLRQLDPLALLAFKVTGSCTVTVPEWLYDWDCPGHYHRRVKALAASTPSVVGPNTSLNLTVTLQSSTIRVSPLLANGGYARDTTQDDSRFVDSFGSTDMIVTSGGTNDSGMFETSLRDERFLPFEGAGAISTWNLSLPANLRSFDYMTISDVILHIRYTARDAGEPLRTQATKALKNMLKTASGSGQALLFCLRYDFPTEWSAFVNGSGNFTATLDKQFFPYPVQAATGLTIDALTLYTETTASPSTPPALSPVAPLGQAALSTLSAGLGGSTGQAQLSLPSDNTVLTRDLARQVFLVLQYHFTAS
jgi:Tc toxin complex TcA C-terminal TcB-binding domain